MNKTLTFLAVILLSGCSGVQRKELPQTAESRLQTDEVVLERTGLTLAESEIEIPAFEVTWVSSSALFTQLKTAMPGDDMRDIYRPAKLSVGDRLIAVNDVMVSESAEGDLNGFYENKLLSAYDSKQSYFPMQFLDAKTGEVKTILSNYGHLKSDFNLRPVHLRVKGTSVSSVRPDTWAARHEIVPGDMLIGSIRLQSVTTRRSWAKFAPHKRSVYPTKAASGSDTGNVSSLLASMFRDMKPYQPDRSGKDGVMGYASLANLTVIKEKKNLRHLSLTHTRYVGLGLQFDCSPYCGRAKPVIKAMFPQSSGSRAGFQLEDLALEVNGKKVHSSWQAVQIIRKLDFGDTLTIRVQRKTEIHDIKVKVDWVYED